MVKGIPKWVMLSTQEVQTVLTPVFDEIVKLITGVLKDTHPNYLQTFISMASYSPVDVP